MSIKPSRAIMLSLLLLILPACGKQGAAPNEMKSDHHTTRVQVRDTNPAIVSGHHNVQNLQMEADNLANIAVKVPNVSRATVVINGAIAYVGITTTDRVHSKKQVANVREEVRKHVQAKIPRYQVRVSNDPRIFKRIQDIGDGLRSGTPINNYRIHINDLNDRMPGIRK
ncbi:YhcN/YlaJ family sporulation lipoprotein [Aneurinibacillus soli]|uniref:Sporulation lipoprotein YhcN/YlaJ n=1 Tax=Aneurinibacillus soli TaxID=1500254 RepID=A0A0U5B6I1_9BACL|nr:YhcN/YlaJ family sporulation lipoprotein [Aneurinibacillus soli]PYE60066.1 YhcN/YlaJ family sporulation lipoprotein [Aneurinibacillus soli]BAU26445.1 sporulation lipoprotein YhcN/YlaJ [Aneurinibacillus soli]